MKEIPGVKLIGDDGTGEIWYEVPLENLERRTLFDYPIAQVKCGAFNNECSSVVIKLEPKKADVNVLNSARTQAQILLASIPLNQSVASLYGAPDENSNSATSSFCRWNGAKVALSIYFRPDYDTKSVEGQVTFRSLAITQKIRDAQRDAVKNKKDGF